MITLVHYSEGIIMKITHSSMGFLVSIALLGSVMPLVVPEQAIAQTVQSTSSSKAIDELIEQSKAKSDANQYQAALEPLEKALQLARSQTDRFQEARVLNRIGMLQHDLNQYKTAIMHYQDALVIAKDLKKTSLEAAILRNMGLVYGNTQEHQKAIEVYQQALPLFVSLSDLNKQASVLRSIGSASAKLSQYPEAIKSFESSLKIYEELGDRGEQIKVLLRLSQTYKNSNQPEKAEIFSQRAKTLKKLNEESASVSKPTNKPDEKYTESQQLYKEAKQLQDKKQFNAALDKYRQALDLIKTQTSEKSLILKGMGDIYHEQKQYEKAIATYQDALTIRKELKQYSRSGVVLLAIAKSQVSLDSYRRSSAIDTLKEAQASFKLGLDKRGELISLFELAKVYQKLDRFDEALETYQKSSIIAGDTPEKNFSEVFILKGMGDIYQEKKEYSKALELYEKALSITEKLEESDRIKIKTDILRNMGEIRKKKSQYSEALETYEKALILARQIKNLGQEAAILYEIGKIYQTQARYPEALAELKKSLDLRKKLDYKSRIGLTLIAIGEVYISVSQYAEALAVFNQAENFFEANDDDPGSIIAKVQITLAYQKLGRFDKSSITLKESSAQWFKFYQNALLILGKLDGQVDEKLIYPKLSDRIKELENTIQKNRREDDRQSEGQDLVILALIHMALQQNSQSLPTYQKALTIYQSIGEPAEQARVMNYMGVVHHRLKQNSNALDNFYQSLRLYQKIGNRSGEGQVLSNIATLLKAQQQTDVAIVFYKQSVNAYEYVRKGIRVLPKEEQEAYAQTLVSTYRNLADLLISEGRLLEAEQVLELLKLQEVTDYAAPTRSQDQAIELRLNQTEQQISAKYNNLIDFGELLKTCEAQTSQNCSQLRTDQRKLTKALNQFIDEIATKKRTTCTTNSEQYCNEPSDKFTSVAQTLINKQPGTLVISPVVLDNKVWILVVSEGGILSRYESKVDRLTLGNRILEFRQLLEDPTSDLTELKAKSKELYDWLIRPIETALNASNNPRHLVFALDRVTRYIPMGTLFDGQRYLAQRYSTATVLSLGETTTQKNTLNDIENTSVLAVGLSDATAKSIALPNVKAEIDAIVRQPGIYPGQRFLNLDFTIQAIADHLSGRKVLHIATHGKFVPNQDASYLVLGNGDPLPIADIRSLSFNGIELVVLSACQTALGNPEQEGTEIPGLSSYFLNKGASAVMASLWSVNDGSTTLLMQQFYKNLSKGMTKAEALQTVQQELIQSKLTTKDIPRGAIAVEFVPGANTTRTANPTTTFAHPYYWAPFILIGNSL
jgi:CHAT domain-containing protein/uncharacterized protein HemY